MRLDAKSRELLNEVLEARGRSHPELSGIADRNHLSESDVEQLCLMLTEELIATGLAPDDEPNERGRRLERLIDEVNRQRIRTGSH